MPPSAAALLIASEPTASSISGVLSGAGVACAIAFDGSQAWRLLASKRPGAVFLESGVDGFDEFNRRLRDEFMGVPPRLLGLVDDGDVDPAFVHLGLAAALVKPVSPQALLRAVMPADQMVTTRIDASRLREMLKLTTMGPELQASLDTLARRLVLLYGAHDCVVLATANEQQWVGSVGEPVPVANWPALWESWAQAADTGAPLVVTADAQSGGGVVAHGGAVQTRFAVPLIGPGSAPLGAVCLLYEGVRPIELEAREALTDLAIRVGAELGWRSIHERVAAERDQLRESAMLDPLMGVLSRAALEQQLVVEIARCKRSHEPLTVAVLDVTGLRLINERHGHLAGDAALKHIAETTRRIVRGQDVVARYGGDEIAVVLAGTNVPGASRLLERVCKSIEAEPFDVGGGTELKVSVTAGLGEYKGEDENGAAVLAKAAAAARVAKGHGDTIVLGDGARARASTEADQRSLDLGPPDRFEAGITLGGMYQIVHEISRGAMGVVYRAEDLGLSRPVAIKMLRPDLVRDKQLVSKFRDEAAVLAALRHEHLVGVYAFGEDGGDVYFVMELVEGVSLEALLHEHADTDTWMANEKISAITSEIASALDAMHDAGLLHRDVKPGNIVLDRARDRAVLLDVGLAMPVGAKSEIAGTPGYMAPEVMRGEEPTPVSDVYGLAATAYAALMRRAPFGEHEDYNVTLRRQLVGPPEHPTSQRPELPAALDALFDRALAVDERKRPRTPGEFARALATALVPRPTDATAPWPSIQAVAAIPPKKKREGNRTLTLSVDSLQSNEKRLTRGVLFRCATRVIGLSNAVAWLSGIARKNRRLADAMSPRTSALAWLPADLFVELLHEVSASGRNVETFGRALAKLALAETFRRFYPSEPSKLTPQSTLSALDLLWSRYHSWGVIKCDSIEAGSASVALSEGPTDVGVCAFTGGLLEAAVELSGGTDVRVVHPSCTARGDRGCRFDVTWSPPK